MDRETRALRLNTAICAQSLALPLGAHGATPFSPMPALQPAFIELRLRELAQLFNSLDPSPFHDRDIDADAEEFILSWARETPQAAEFELVLHLEAKPAPERAAAVEGAVQHYFAARAEMKRREFRALLRRGRTSLIVGLVFLFACLGASELIATQTQGTFLSILREGLTIGGWVAMWRPLEIYLYDWWPLRDEYRTLTKLSRMRVRIV